MLYKHGKRTREVFGRFYFYFILVFYILVVLFDKAIIPLALVGYDVIIANSAVCTSLAIYHLISNSCMLVE